MTVSQILALTEQLARIKSIISLVIVLLDGMGTNVIIVSIIIINILLDYGSMCCR